MPHFLPFLLLQPSLDSMTGDEESLVPASTTQIGTLFVGKDAPILTDAGIVLSNQAMTLSGGPNILLAQSITVDGTGTTYTERLANGQYLMTVTMVIDSAVKSDFFLATTGDGYDLSAVPKTITTPLLRTSQ